jgi:hypothetical protein
MATYLVLPDDYAGWNGAGRNFALVGAGSGIAALLCWAATHGHFPHVAPTAASDQLFLSAIVWIGTGIFALMAFAAFGSILLSSRSRGTLTVTEQGVARSIGNRTRSLAWHEITGFVPMPYGGVTLIPTPGKPRIVVPRFLDDYRACIAELKEQGLQRLPPSALRKKTTWLQRGKYFLATFLYLSATSRGYSHATRITLLIATVCFCLWLWKNERTDEAFPAPRWLTVASCAALIAWTFWRMAHTW